MLTVNSDYHKMGNYAKTRPVIFGIIAFSIFAGITIIIIVTVILTSKDIVCKNKYSDECLYSKMLSKRIEYPERRVWTNSNCYSSKYLGGGCGCAGFAYLLSDVCFGTLKSTTLKDCPDFKVGDVVRIGDYHSIIILKIDYKNDIITITEGNYGGTIHWGRTFSTDNLKWGCTYIQRRNPN